ncbi:MAG: Holliday junction resolvase RuvX [Arsenophonus sp.]|nr:MAG: Holliday junction resolvase RuvX [Arsenophonus sp.]
MKKNINNCIIIGFDFGIFNIGVAIGQTITNTAQPINFLKSKNGCPNWEKIQKIFQIWKPSIAIIGLPLNMDGTEQNISYKSRNFATQIKKKYRIPIQLHDERLSTVEARKILFQKKGYKSLTKKNINSISAVIILESWLIKKNNF